MNNTFLLSSETAKNLYEFAKNLPIIDYHNHLSVNDICEDTRYFDVYKLWVMPDPYKHRAMRMCGVPEKYITGDATDREKFKKWCKVFPDLLGNPLYVWSKMELETIFNISEMPNGENADKIYDMCNEYLKNNEVTPKSILKKFNAEFICPCMSLTDGVEVFEKDLNVSPSLRGDDVVNPTIEFVKKLENITNIKINDLRDFEKAILKRLEVFAKCGCVFSDHALDNGFEFYSDDGKNNERFSAKLSGKAVEEEKLSSYILEFLGNCYAKYGFVMQLHIGAERYTSSVLREKVGAQGGFAGIGNSVDVKTLVKFLDTLDKKKERLPKTVLFTLNPADNALISVLSGSYSKDGVKGLISQGPAWWWCDHKQGIKEMLANNAVYGLLSNFVGMTTDSRSFLSFVRHDYFRRTLCDFLGEKFEKNELLCTYEELSNIVYKMCYENAKNLTGGNKNGF